jgi:hypothetical protein
LRNAEGCRIACGDVPEERSDCRQSGIAGLGAVAALALEMVEESKDDVTVEVRDRQLARLPAGTLGRVEDE